MWKFKSLLLVGFLSLAGANGLAVAADVQMFVRHEVVDYTSWKKVYDAFSPLQKNAGIFNQVVYQAIDNPNDVTVIHSFHNIEKAKAFASSPELKKDMEKAGVKGIAQIWFASKAKN